MLPPIPSLEYPGLRLSKFVKEKQETEANCVSSAAKVPPRFSASKERFFLLLCR